MTQTPRPTLRGAAPTMAVDADASTIMNLGNDDADEAKMKRYMKEVPIAVYMALAAEATAGVLLTATFNTFHVETFLTEYKLDLASYASGHVLYAVINTLNDLVGAYIVDAWAVTKGRAWLMLCGGCVWSIMFLLPWFPWRAYPALHFVVSLSCYDTLYSFCAIAGGSLLTEMHVSDRQRIQILRVKTIVGMASAFVVMQLGQYYFADKTAFRAYCVALALLAAALYGLFYSLLQTQAASYLIAMPRPSAPSSASSLSIASITALLKDFYHLKNFRYWLGMEMCLETQCNFNKHYMRIFLVHFAAGLWSPATIASVIAGLPLLKQLVKLAVFSVMDRIGVYRLYHDAFVTKLMAAVLTLYAVHTLPHPSAVLVAFLLLNMVVTELPTGGFPIAMSNMHKELSLRRQQTGRGVVASSSAMFMGLNAVFCKPMDSLLPILAAMQLNAAGFQANATSPAVSAAMSRLLVYPPLMLSLLQLWSWRRYTLDATHVASIEEALSTSTSSPPNVKQVV